MTSEPTRRDAVGYPARVELDAALAGLVRAERGRLVAALVRRYGFDLAEESVDAAIEAALASWPEGGVPSSPRAWLLAVARRRAIDRVRHRALADRVHDSLAAVAPEASSDEEDGGVPDDRLRLLFTCCHPAIARDAQVALALRWLSGLSTEDVARAFCVPVATMAQRLTRAKSKIELAGIPYEIPERSELPERVSAVLEVVYAIFNEGYVATRGDALQRVDLAEEAIYLAELVASLLPDSADAQALLALVCLVHARRGARVDAEGEMIPLEEQERSRFDRERIARGKAALEAALASGPPSAFAIEAAIQALHDDAPSWEATDFPQIVRLYELLAERTGAAVVRVNLAVARAMVDGPAVGLAALDELRDAAGLEGHPALPAAEADLLRRLGRADDARAAYDRAIAATKNEVERRFLARRRASLG